MRSWALPNIQKRPFVHNSVCSQLLEGLFAILAECSQFCLRPRNWRGNPSSCCWEGGLMGTQIVNKNFVNKLDNEVSKAFLHVDILACTGCNIRTLKTGSTREVEYKLWLRFRWPFTEVIWAFQPKVPKCLKRASQASRSWRPKSQKRIENWVELFFKIFSCSCVSKILQKPSSAALRSENPHAHKSKIALPPPPPKPQNTPPPWTWRFSCRKNAFFQASIKLAQPFPDPELRTKFTDTRIFLIRTTPKSFHGPSQPNYAQLDIFFCNVEQPMDPQACANGLIGWPT